jgi:CHRD domain
MDTKNAMSRKIVTGILIVATVTVIVSVAAVVAISILTNSKVFAQEEKFTARLSGQQELPPTNSKATGMAEFTVIGQTIKFTVNASNIQGVTAAHIHLGKPGENGLIIATLFKNNSPTNKVSETGSITSDTGAFQYVTDLTTPMNDGETYVDIHTQQHPNGEIRGQITSSSTGGK